MGLEKRGESMRRPNDVVGPVFMDVLIYPGERTPYGAIKYTVLKENSTMYLNFISKIEGSSGHPNFVNDMLIYLNTKMGELNVTKCYAHFSNSDLLKVLERVGVARRLTNTDALHVDTSIWNKIKLLIFGSQVGPFALIDKSALETYCSRGREKTPDVSTD